PAFAGPDADAIVHRKDEDLAITDLAVGAAPPCLDDRIDGRLDEVFIDRDLEFDLPQQVDRKLVSAVNFRVPFLTAETLYVHHCQSEDLDVRESLFDRLELRGL